MRLKGKPATKLHVRIAKQMLVVICLCEKDTYFCIFANIPDDSWFAMVLNTPFEGPL